MNVGILQASSQRDKNPLLFDAVRQYAGGHRVFNLGCYPDEPEVYSYVEVSLEIGLLLSAGALDFVVTGCSSGQGMMLACNNMPGVLCGYAPTPQDAYLFAQINDGNALSLPLGLHYGWAGELNLRYTLEALFSQPFGGGYPRAEAPRKRRDAAQLKAIRRLSQVSMPELLERLDPALLHRALSRKNVADFLWKHGSDRVLMERLRTLEAQNAK